MAKMKFRSLAPTRVVNDSIYEPRYKESQLPYTKYSYNNKRAVMKDPNGARCVYCLGSPFIHKNTKTVCGESTILCPLCGIDAVVPYSVIPSPVEETLEIWHTQGFGDEL